MGWPSGRRFLDRDDLRLDAQRDARRGSLRAAAHPRSHARGRLVQLPGAVALRVDQQTWRVSCLRDRAQPQSSYRRVDHRWQGLLQDLGYSGRGPVRHPRPHRLHAQANRTERQYVGAWSGGEGKLAPPEGDELLKGRPHADSSAEKSCNAARTMVGSRSGAIWAIKARAAREEWRATSAAALAAFFVLHARRMASCSSTKRTPPAISSVWNIRRSRSARSKYVESVRANSRPASGISARWNRRCARAHSSAFGSAACRRISVTASDSSAIRMRSRRGTVTRTPAPSIRTRTPYTVSMSPTSSAVTRVRLPWSPSTMPSACSIFMASRRGVRLTPSRSASSTWERLAPSGMAPSRIRRRRYSCSEPAVARPLRRKGLIAARETLERRRRFSVGIGVESVCS